LTIETNKPEEIERAQKVGRAFCDDFQEVDLGNMYRGMVDQLAMGENETINSTLTMEDKVRFGNVKARTRMVYLYNLAQKYKGMVLSTDNLTEYFLGFWTLHGDVGDFAPIQNLWKTEVYNLSVYFASQYINGKPYDTKAEALELCVKATPTDGLGITNSDLEQMGAKSYSDVDLILKTWLTEDSDQFTYDDHLRFDSRPEDYEDFKKLRETYRNNPVVQRYERTHFKRNNPYNISRTNLFQE
jgi:NAD+ synthetase